MDQAPQHVAIPAVLPLLALIVVADLAVVQPVPVEVASVEVVAFALAVVAEVALREADKLQAKDIYNDFDTIKL